MCNILHERDELLITQSETFGHSDKIEVMCAKGHLRLTEPKYVEMGKKCPVCYGNVRRTQEEVRREFASHGLTMVGTYVNNKISVDVECPKCGRIFGSSIWKIRRGYGCRSCSMKKYTTDDVVKSLAVEGYTLLTNYRDVDTNIIVRCDKGHIYETSYSRWNIFGYRCSKCSGNQRLKFEDVKLYVESKGYVLHTRQYRNNSTKLLMTCPSGHKCEISAANFYKGRRCGTCWGISTSSKQEKEVLHVTRSVTDCEVLENDRTVLLNDSTKQPLELDIWIPKLNKAIEFNGCYWHSLPGRKKIDDLKIRLCERLGIDLLVIWDEEWTNDKEKCIEKICDFLETVNG